MPARRLGPIGIALIYLSVSWTYIFLSTLWLYAMHPEDIWDLGEQIELVKGLIFVTLTAGLIWWLVRRLTRRLEAETARAEALAETNRQLFDTVPEPAWVYDDETLKFLEVNAAAVRRYGWPREEFLAMDIRQIRPAEDLPILEKAIENKRAGRHDAGVFRHMDRHGRIFRVRVTAQSVNYQGRRAWLVVAWNVEDLIAAQESIEKLNRELEQRVHDRTRGLRRAIAELEWFTQAVSHDLKRPVSQLGEVAKELVRSAGSRLTPEETESAYRMVGASVRLEHLVEDLLSDSQQRSDSGPPDSVSLAVLINGVLGQLRREIGAETDRVTLEEPLHWVRAHRPTLTRIVTGLLSMALRSSPPGSPVRLTAQANGRDVRLSIAAEGEWICEDDRRLITPPDDAIEPRVHGGSEVAVIVRSVWRVDGELEARLDTHVSPVQCTLTLSLPQSIPPAEKPPASSPGDGV